MDDKENETHTDTHTLFQCAELMVGARRKNINYTYSANFKENGVKKLQSSVSSRHIITHSFSIAVVFSNLHTHNNQRDTIRAFPLSINKSRREFLSVRVVLLGNKKIYVVTILSPLLHQSISPGTEQRKIELRKGHFADILTAGAVGLSSVLEI